MAPLELKYTGERTRLKFSILQTAKNLLQKNLVQIQRILGVQPLLRNSSVQ